MHNINRPISPHLTIYNAQKSSIFSIWHRISGVVMFSSIISPIVLFKFLLLSYKNFYSIGFILDNFITSWAFPGLYIVVSAIFLYHITNGIRHFLWDSVMHVSTKGMHKDSNILLIIVCFIVALKFLV